MKKHFQLISILLIGALAYTPISPELYEIKQAESHQNKKQSAKNIQKPALTNYQYDDLYYKYNKYEQFIRDNIEYSNSGSTRIYY